MKIKKKELRRGLAQVPINFPDPEVRPEAFPDVGGFIDLEREMVAVEALCKQLGHNEISVRRPVLEQVPVYITKLMAPIATMEAEYEGQRPKGSGARKEDESAEEGEIEVVQAYFKAHPSSPNPYYYHNLAEGLKVYREKAAKEHRKAQQQASMRELKAKRAEARQQREQQGRYASVAPLEDHTAEEEEVDDVLPKSGIVNEHREKYRHWIQTWADVELVLLKLSRGLFYCLWHSDKPLDQLQCADTISRLVAVPPTPRGQLLMASCLFRVLAREWPTIDHYRMDKYLALVRRLLQQIFQVMKRNCRLPSQQTRPTPKGPKQVSSSTSETAKKKKKNKKGKAQEEAAAGRKRSRDDDAEGDEEEDEEEVAPPSASSTAFTARGVAEALLLQHFPEDLLLQRVVREALFLFQVHLVPNTTSVGLTMHLCDVSFDELEKAFNAECPATLFVVVAAGIPLYAMSQGNYVEKRVLDHFFPPLAAGVLSSRRAVQLVTSLTQSQQERLRSKSAVAAGEAKQKLSAAAIEALAQERANADTRVILETLVRACQTYAVCRGTVRVVRVMFSEAELVLRQALDPEAYTPLSRSAQRRRIEKEIEEVNETRRRVKEEREGVKEAKKTVKRKELIEKARARKKALLAKREDTDVEGEGDETTSQTKAKKSKVDLKSLVKRIKEEEAAAQQSGKKVKRTRNSKRKKDYQLTKKDLYGDADQEE